MPPTIRWCQIAWSGFFPFARIACRCSSPTIDEAQRRLPEGDREEDEEAEEALQHRPDYDGGAGGGVGVGFGGGGGYHPRPSNQYFVSFAQVDFG